MLHKHLNIQFPDALKSDDSGLVCYGGSLDINHILSAYTQGIFPWPQSNIEEVLWFAPKNRGIIDFKNFKIPLSLKKFLKKSPFKITFNQDFESVIKGCKKSHQSKGEWITEELVSGYLDLFNHGYAYSVECKESNNLVGGLYGVIIGNFISAESMFFTKDNASKVALVSLIEHLVNLENKNDDIKNNRFKKIDWIDTQMVTPVVESLGGHYITQENFMARLSQKDFTVLRSEYFPHK